MKARCCVLALAMAGGVAMTAAGEVRVSVIWTAVERPLLTTFFGIEARAEPQLTIRVNIRNAGVDDVEYSTWRGHAAVTLTDNRNRSYGHVSFGEDSRPYGSVDGSAVIAPGAAVTDVLWFEPPDEGVESLALTLPRANFGAKGVMTFKIPGKRITFAEPSPPPTKKPSTTTPAAPPAKGSAAPEKESLLATVFGRKRAEDRDTVYLEGGDVLHGQILSKTIGISTEYGKLDIDVEKCAGISFGEGRNRFGAIVTVNGNRLTGSLTDRTIEFLPGAAPKKIKLTRDEVRLLLPRLRGGELDFMTADKLATS